MAYIRRAAAPPQRSCLFCRVARSGADRGNLVLARRPHALLMLNRYPYNPAHVMVAMTRHVARFTELSTAEQADWMALTALAERTLTAEYHPDGMNLGVNLGRVAGAGFPGHLHQHLVPRWNGDTNFMPTLAETRVLPESLGRTWSRLRRAIEGVEAGRSRAAAGAGRQPRRRTRSRR
jgi:ATP adenylyltransferase